MADYGKISLKAGPPAATWRDIKAALRLGFPRFAYFYRHHRYLVPEVEEELLREGGLAFIRAGEEMIALADYISASRREALDRMPHRRESCADGRSRVPR
ncbi:MAG: hypothetical protein JW895_02845 [Thermoleophilaceae bacterium]|nr:hypothetical protein [Thermoleophilaceae bacterium]